MIEKENYENRGNFMNDYILEVCVDSAESALAAAIGGASRLELCQNLVIGGTTPGSKLFEVIRRQTNIPIHASLKRSTEIAFSAASIGSICGYIFSANKVRFRRLIP